MNDSPALSDSQNQSITEAVIRLLATYIFGVGLYGHFGSLTNVPAKIHTTNVIAFLFYPGLVVGQICVGIGRAIDYYRHHNNSGQQGGPGPRFYLDGILGVWATTPPRSTVDGHRHAGLTLSSEDRSDEIGQQHENATVDYLPLFEAGHVDTKIIPEPVAKNWRWLGRLFICSFLVVQSVGTCIVFVRRQQHGCGLLADKLLGTMAFASALTGVLGLYLQCTRSRWYIVTNPSTGVLDGDLRSRWSEQHPEYEYRTISDLANKMAIGFVASWPLRQGSTPFIDVFYNPVETIMANGLILAMTLATAMYILVFATSKLVSRFSRNRRSHVINWRNLWTTSQVAATWFLVFISWQDLGYSLTVSVIDLVYSEEGCWKDPLSDILFVI